MTSSFSPSESVTLPVRSAPSFCATVMVTACSFGAPFPSPGEQLIHVSSGVIFQDPLVRTSSSFVELRYGNESASWLRCRKWVSSSLQDVPRATDARHKNEIIACIFIKSDF